MRNLLLLLLTILISLVGCQTNMHNAIFNFGDDLVFEASNDTYVINLQQSSTDIMTKHQELSAIINDQSILQEIVAITTTTANILNAANIQVIGAPTSTSLSKNLQSKQYTLANTKQIDKAKVLNIGSAITPNIEAIIELNPKLVLYSSAMPKSEFMDTLEQSSIKTAALNQADYTDMFVLLDVINHVTNFENIQTKQLMKELVNTLKVTKELIENQSTSKQTVAILQVSDGNIELNNANTIIGKIVEDLGLENVFANNQNGLLNSQSLLTTNPDYIIYYSHGYASDAITNFEQELTSDTSIYRDLNAVKNKQTFQIANEEFTFNASVDFDIIKVIQFLAEQFYE